MINKANLKYRKDGTAIILKLATPILMTRKGMVATKSTVDYYGLRDGGTFIAFDAKSTNSKSSIPLSNFHQHQVVYMNRIEELGGDVFWLVRFREHFKDEAYILTMETFNRFYEHPRERESIPFSVFQEECIKVPINNYLSFMDS